MATGRHSNWRLAGFASLSIPLTAMMLPVTLYLPNYYATDLGVSLSGVMWAFAAMRIFDLAFDPALGLVMDRVETRFGRFRPWVVAGVPIAMIGLYMLFMAEPGITPIYILGWMIFAMIGQSMGQLGAMAWVAQAAPQYSERTRVYGWMQAMTLIGMLVILTLPVIVEKLGGSEALGVQVMGWLVIGLLPPTVLLALKSLPEPRVRSSGEVAGWQHYWSMIRRPNVLRLLGTDILLGTAPTLAGTLLFFYYKAAYGIDRGEAAAFLLFYFVGGLVGAPIWPQLAKRIGKHRALTTAAVIYAFFQVMVLVAPNNDGARIALMFLAGLPFGAGSILLRSMMADVRDEVRLETGVDQSGMLFSLLSGTIKIGTTIAVSGSLAILTAVGFDAKAGTANSEQAVTVLGLLFTLAPAAMGLIAAWLISGHKLDAAAHDEIRRRLDERDGEEDERAGAEPLPNVGLSPAWSAEAPHTEPLKPK